MRTITYHIAHEVYDADEGLECWIVYQGVTLHYPYGDVAGKEYETSFATEAEARAFVDHLYQELAQ